MTKPQSSLSFRIMVLQFKIRDLLKPRDKILKEVGIKLGSHVLDFGCGPGGYILPLAKIIGPSGKINALDINPIALQMVKSLALRHKLNNTTTILSPGPTSLPDSSVDVVLLYDVFHDLSQPDEVMIELNRILKADGILSVSDHHLTGDEIVSGITRNGMFRLTRKGENTYNFSRILR
jgi:ubiquinone/menaquinone biosynthesis C-methylase UbiE